MSSTTGTGANPFADDHMVDAALAGVDPIGKKPRLAKTASEALGTRIGKILVVALAVLWTIPTFGVLVSSFRPENDVSSSNINAMRQVLRMSLVWTGHRCPDGMWVAPIRPASSTAAENLLIATQYPGP